MEFPREEYWSGLPFSSLGDLPYSGIEPTSLVSPGLAGRFSVVVSSGKKQPMVQERGTQMDSRLPFLMRYW